MKPPLMCKQELLFAQKLPLQPSGLWALLTCARMGVGWGHRVGGSRHCKFTVTDTWIEVVCL